MLWAVRHAVGAGHAREQKGAGIGAFLVPERLVARMAASYSQFSTVKSGTRLYSRILLVTNTAPILRA